MNEITEEIERLEHKIKKLKLEESNLERIELKQWMKNKIYNDYIYNNMYCDMMNEIKKIKSLKIVSRKLFIDKFDKPQIFSNLNVLNIIFGYL